PDRFEALDGEAHDKGLCVCRADLIGCRGKDDLLARLAVALRCPDSFGGNWDALADVLRDLSWLPATGVALLCDHAGELRDGGDATFATLEDVCRDALRRQVPHQHLERLERAGLDAVRVERARAAVAER